MNAIELLTLNEAKDQVSSGQASQALPRLFKLAAAYPQDKEIQAAIREALNAPAPAVKSTPAAKLNPTKPYSQPVATSTASKPAATTSATKATATNPTTKAPASKAEKPPSTGKAWYGLPFAGTLVTAAGAVLPWIKVSQGTSEANFNSLGGYIFDSAAPNTSQDGLVEQVTSIVLGSLHGWWLFGVLGVLLVATLFGLFTTGKGAALVMLLTSAGGLALLGWSYTQLKAAIDLLGSSSDALAAQPGLGFWGSVAGIVINLVGTIVVLIRLNPAEKLQQGLKDLTA